MSLRIGYVYLLVSPIPGVEQKIRDQAAALDRMGCTDIELLAIAPHAVETGPRLQHSLRPRRTPIEHLEYGFRRFKIIHEVICNRGYDLLLLRYPFADPAAPWFADRYPVVSEHVTKETDERLGLLRSSLPVTQRLHKTVSLRWERRFGGRYLSACRAIVAETDEIRDFEIERAGKSIPSLTHCNGIDVERVPHTRFQAFNGKELSLLFLGASDNPYHGLDRLFASLSAYVGSCRVAVHLVGSLSTPRHLSLPRTVSVHRHGFLSGGELDSLMKKTNLALGSLAVFRRGLSQVALIKSREYAARGIPFVLAAPDPDFGSASNCPDWVLSVPNDASLLRIEALIDFASRATRLETEEQLSLQMREYAQNNLDWVPKLQRLSRFLHSL